MTTILMRSALIFHGHNPAPEIHSIEIGPGGQRHVVTWQDIHRARRAHQVQVLQRIRATETMRAYRVWVAYFHQWFFGGWQAFIDNGNASHWIDRDRPHLKEALMREFPLSSLSDWESWKVEFARVFTRGTRCRKPRGVAIVWWDGCRCIRRAAA
jgi:hypothetical protein